MSIRPECLFPLFAPLTSLKGVGPRLGKVIEKAIQGNMIRDLLWHVPSDVIDRRAFPGIAHAEPGRIASFRVTIVEHLPNHTAKQPYRIRCCDDSGEMTLTFFRAKAEYLSRILPIGETRLISGKMDIFHGMRQIHHPDYVLTEDEQDILARLDTIYPLTAGLSSKILSKSMRHAIEKIPDLPEWLASTQITQNQWPAWASAMRDIHLPPEDISVKEYIQPDSPTRQRLLYDEILADQLALALIRQKQLQKPGMARQGDNRLISQLLQKLPFTLTKGQQQAIAEIIADMAAPKRMLRLVQGDVGAGKTLVALTAMLNAIEGGWQTALLAPTEILARQHYAGIRKLLAEMPVEIALLTGRDKGKKREKILDALANGEIDMIIGTHALIQPDIAFQNLGFAVIDEQHRFGVSQRLALSEKGRAVDVLVMTATPIPRSLLLTQYGDIDTSIIRDKPPGRLPIQTIVKPLERLEEIITALSRALAQGTKAYWICPLVEESEKLDLAAAEDRYAELQTLFGDQVALVHGKMKPAEKDLVMSRFSGKPLADEDMATSKKQRDLLAENHPKTEANLLIATTVIEVGVDVPAATIMVIEHAERFGLAQLHQLRGRIGRGQEQSTCILLYGSPLGKISKARLTIMRESNDGFQLAEEDLRLRGGGDILGTKQSGLPTYHFGDLDHVLPLLEIARKDAQICLQNDPDLTSERGKALRVLLYLFGKDQGIKTLRSG